MRGRLQLEIEGYKEQKLQQGFLSASSLSNARLHPHPTSFSPSLYMCRQKHPLPQTEQNKTEPYFNHQFFKQAPFKLHPLSPQLDACSLSKIKTVQHGAQIPILSVAPCPCYFCLQKWKIIFLM